MKIDKRKLPKTKEHKEKIRLSNLGQKRSLEAKQKMSLAKKGKPSGRKPRLGMKASESTKRKMSESMKLSYKLGVRKPVMKCGKESHFWKGGISFEEYSLDWTMTLKRSIRECDKYTCKNCGEQQGDRALDVHHIDYNKKNCSPENLISLCHRCHMLTQTKRDYWINRFNFILNS